MSNLPVSHVDCRNNREERLPVVFCVDGSSSMLTDDAIGKLNAGLQRLAEDLRSDEDASMRVQVTVVRFGGDVEQPDRGWEPAAEAARTAQQQGRFSFFPVSVITDSADREHEQTLAAFGHKRKVLPIDTAEFAEFFDFVTRHSVKASRVAGEDEEIERLFRQNTMPAM